MGLSQGDITRHGKQMDPPRKIGRNALVALEKGRGGIGERVIGALNAILNDLEARSAEVE